MEIFNKLLPCAFFSLVPSGVKHYQICDVEVLPVRPADESARVFAPPEYPHPLPHLPIISMVRPRGRSGC